MTADTLQTQVAGLLYASSYPTRAAGDAPGRVEVQSCGCGGFFYVLCEKASDAQRINEWLATEPGDATWRARALTLPPKRPECAP